MNEQMLDDIAGLLGLLVGFLGPEGLDILWLIQLGLGAMVLLMTGTYVFRLFGGR